MSVFIPIPKKGNAKECSNYHAIALISHASKEIEENNRMGKTRDLFKKIRKKKKIRHNKVIFHAKMGTIKERNGKNLTEGEELRRGGMNKQKNFTKKVLMTWITTTVWSLT